MKTLQQLAAHLREARIAGGLDQKDMKLLIGMTQQQYQRVESGADHRVSTLLRILEGMNLELMVVPRELAPDLEALLDSGAGLDTLHSLSESNDLSADDEEPWQTLWHDLSDDDA